MMVKKLTHFTITADENNSFMLREPGLLLVMLNDKDNALQELELRIAAAALSIASGARQGLFWFLKAVPRSRLSELRYD